MPIPKPSPSEKEGDFIGRCMTAMKEEFPDNKQRLAVCYGSWRETKKLAEYAEEEFNCECIKCGYKMKTVVHCKDIKCPECGGQMRRVERPGPGQSLKSYDINNKELIAVGTWNTMDGKLVIKEKDIDALMESYNEINKPGIRKIPIKLGHDDDQNLLQKDGYPSAGWVENLRKKTVDGVLKIVGDLKTIPDKIYKIIQNKGYVNVSPEISKNFTYLNTGKKYKWLFNRLALLGIDQPAQDLDELVKVYTKEGSGNDEIVFEMSEPMVTDELKKTKPQLKEEIMSEELKEKLESEIKARQDEIKALQEEAKAQEAKAKEQEDEKTKLQKSLNEAEEKAKTTEEEKKEAGITAFIDGAIKDGKILPVHKDAFTQILMAMPEVETYKFTDDGEEKEGNALDLIKSIVDTMPDLVKFAELTEHKEGVTEKEKEEDGTPIDNINLATKLDKIVKEEKVSVEEAYALMEEREEL